MKEYTIQFTELPAYEKFLLFFFFFSFFFLFFFLLLFCFFFLFKIGPSILFQSFGAFHIQTMWEKWEILEKTSWAQLFKANDVVS